MGAYRMDQAAGAALLLALLAFGLFWLFDFGGRHAQV
jgi:thiamine transport system permease protein